MTSLPSNEKTLWWMRDAAKILSQNGTRDHAEAVWAGADDIERLTRERDEAVGRAEQWRLQAEGLDHDLTEAKAEIERLRSDLQGVQLGAEGMGWAPRRKPDER